MKTTGLGLSEMKQLDLDAFGDIDLSLNEPSISVDQRNVAKKDLIRKGLQRLRFRWRGRRMGNTKGR